MCTYVHIEYVSKRYWICFLMLQYSSSSLCLQPCALLPRVHSNKARLIRNQFRSDAHSCIQQVYGGTVEALESFLEVAVNCFVGIKSFAEFHFTSLQQHTPLKSTNDEITSKPASSVHLCSAVPSGLGKAFLQCVGVILQQNATSFLPSTFLSPPRRVTSHVTHRCLFPDSCTVHFGPDPPLAASIGCVCLYLNLLLMHDILWNQTIEAETQK